VSGSRTITVLIPMITFLAAALLASTLYLARFLSKEKMITTIPWTIQLAPGAGDDILIV
jgi:hypothetical protein